MPTRMFATTMPGLGPLLADEIDAATGMVVTSVGFDGRADVVLFEASFPRAALGFRLAEDVFAEIGRTLRAEGDRAPWIVGRIWRTERLERALATRAAVTAPARRRATFRVVARVLHERSFLRTELRREATSALAGSRPEWRAGDPADVEVWVGEYLPGKFVAGVRLSDARMRQHDGRAVERAGALRPAVAAAMVRLAGGPGDAVLDPCCGSGTVLAEALAGGWEQAYGLDIDPEAVTAARRNAPGATVDKGDARELPFSEGDLAAVISNLPFGQQYELSGELGRVLAEVARVTRPGGSVVLLVPSVPRTAVPGTLRLEERHPIRLLGTKTAIWVYRRIPS